MQTRPTSAGNTPYPRSTAAQTMVDVLNLPMRVVMDRVQHYVNDPPFSESQHAAEGTFFLCPQCLTPLTTPPDLCTPQDQDLDCPGCGRAWPVREGIYIFKS